MSKILVIDPSRSMRSTLKERLEYEGYKVEVAENTIDGLSLYSKDRFDVVLCGQPDACLKIPTPWIRLSHDNSPESAVIAMQHGATDFITKPININRLLTAVKKSIAESNIVREDGGVGEPEPVKAEEPQALKQRSKKLAVSEIVGDSPQMKHLRYLIDKVAPTEARVLIMGDNGTGKELVARWLHEKSPRREGPFVEVNCAAIPSELIESELFGHEKGAFTSAIRQRKGKFEQAEGGTLFLDEIGDMSLDAQAKVLRVLQERKITRVGSDKDINVNVRVIAATNKNVPEEIGKGNFREDLFHRLSVIIIHVPPLVEHIGDVPQLVDHFLKAICAEYSLPVKSIDSKAIEELKKMKWTGNIRELRNVVERFVVLCSDKITIEDVRSYAFGVS